MDDRRDPILPLTFALISFPISNLEAHQEKDSSLKKSTVATFNLLSPQFHPAVSWLVALRGKYALFFLLNQRNWCTETWDC